jgi:hypothetical protein
VDISALDIGGDSKGDASEELNLKPHVHNKPSQKQLGGNGKQSE